nr:MAG TPA: hypothetical protein [Caudoviricetes sp.]
MIASAFTAGRRRVRFIHCFTFFRDGGILWN